VVRQALDAGARRIAHGVAAAADQSLARDIAGRGVCLCVCPSSNRRIGVEPDLRTLAAHGVQLCVNTDDPAMVPSTLEGELAIATTEFRLPRDTLVATAWAHRFGQATLPLNNSVK
jgi:adenosine deaminase